MASHQQVRDEGADNTLPPPILPPSNPAEGVKSPLNSSSSGILPAVKDDDRYKLNERFLQTHEQMFERALREIQNGRKETCWVWFILPTEPFIVDGREVGSRVNRYYALRSDDEVIAFISLSNSKVNLRQNYIDMVTAIEAQLRCGRTLFDLFGDGDSKKVKSSFALFSRIAGEMGDTELAHACSCVLDVVCKNKPKKRKSKLGPIKNIFKWKSK